MTSLDPIPPEFSRLIDLTRAGTVEQPHEIVADETERRALAERFDIVSLDRFEAEVQLKRLPGDFVRLSATFCADLVQACVVTLEPVSSRIEERFTLLYGAAEPEARDIIVEESTETIEPLLGTVIDIGEAVAQQLSLAIDPFPRSPDAPEISESDAAAKPDSPFAALDAWRKRDKSGD